MARGWVGVCAPIRCVSWCRGGMPPDRGGYPPVLTRAPAGYAPQAWCSCHLTPCIAKFQTALERRIETEVLTQPIRKFRPYPQKYQGTSKKRQKTEHGPKTGRLHGSLSVLSYRICQQQDPPKSGSMQCRGPWCGTALRQAADACFARVAGTCSPISAASRNSTSPGSTPSTREKACDCPFCQSGPSAALRGS
jgi:hypothetical protein